MSAEIDPSTCSDEDIIKFIEEVRGEDALHYKSNWIIMRSLKIIFRVLQRPEDRKDMKDKKPGTLTKQEEKDIKDLIKKK